MTEHRNVLEPGVLLRLGSSMEQIGLAWQADLNALHLTEVKLADTQRDLNASLDRTAFVERDLREAREEISALTRRNAHLEAQLQSVYEKAEDARDGLDALSRRTVDAARTAPPLPEKPLAADDLEGGVEQVVGEQVHSQEDDDPPPAFLRHRDPRIPGIQDHEFQPRRVVAQR